MDLPDIIGFSNLRTAGDAEIRALLEPFGAITEVSIIRDKVSQVSKGNDIRADIVLKMMSQFDIMRTSKNQKIE